MERMLSLRAHDVLRSVQLLSHMLADTYGVYLKTQNYHWNIVSDNFYALHKFLESHYEALANAIDTIAERIRTLGHPAPGTFSALQRLTQLEEDPEPLEASEMLRGLLKDHQTLIQSLREGIRALKEGEDEGTIDLFIKRLKAHEKMAWMLNSHLYPAPILEL